MTTELHSKGKQPEKPEKTIIIYVNGNEESVPDGNISYEQVVALACKITGNNPSQFHTVTYSRGPSENDQGSLAPEGEVKIKNKMIFDATPTTRS